MKTRNIFYSQRFVAEAVTKETCAAFVILAGFRLHACVTPYVIAETHSSGYLKSQSSWSVSLIAARILQGY